MVMLGSPAVSSSAARTWARSRSATRGAPCAAVRCRPRAVAQRPLPSIAIATWRGSAIDDQRYEAPLQVVLDEPPGHPHGLPGEPGIGGGEGGEVGGGDARQVDDEPGAQGDRTRDLIVLDQHPPP